MEEEREETERNDEEGRFQENLAAGFGQPPHKVLLESAFSSSFLSVSSLSSSIYGMHPNYSFMYSLTEAALEAWASMENRKEGYWNLNGERKYEQIHLLLLSRTLEFFKI